MLIVCPSCASSYSLTPEQLGAGRSLRCASCRTTWFARPEDAQPEPGATVEPDPAPVAASAAPEPPPVIEGSVVSVRDEPPPVEDGAAGDAASPTEAPPGKRRFPRLALPRLRVPRPRLPRIALPGRLRLPRRRRDDAPAPRRFRPSSAHAAALALVVLVAIGVTQRNTVVRWLPQTARLYAALGMPVNLRGLEFAQLRSEIVADKDQAILVVEGEIRAVSPGRTTVPKVAVSIRAKNGQEIYAWTSEVPRASLSPGESIPFRTRLVAPPAEGQDVVVRFADSDQRLARSQR